MQFRFVVPSLLVLALAHNARADEAESLIHDGVEARRHHDDAGALKLFEQAYEKGHSPRALAQVALAEQAMGKWILASEHLRQALAIQNDAWIAKNRAALTEAATRVAEHVGWIEIVGGSAGAEVRLDGIARGTLPLERPLAANTGTVAIDLVLTSRLPVRRTTTVRAGETTREAFDALSAAATPATGFPAAREPTSHSVNAGATDAEKPSSQLSATPPDKGPADSASTSSSLRLPVVLGTVGLSAAALVFGAVKHSTWLSKVDSFNNMADCDPTLSGRGSKACAGLYDEGQTAKSLAFIGYGAAGALAATSVILYFALDEAHPEGSRVACSVSPVNPGMSCAFRF